jgi:renalase
MRVVVIGAGLAGLVAARELTDLTASDLAASDLAASGASPIDVVVVDKGRSPGGRLATRRIGPATFDHGAQFFTVRTPAFRRRVDDWLERGLVRVWNHGFASDDGHPRYVATAGMTSLAKDLARGLRVECSTMAFAVRPSAVDGATWNVVIDDGTIRPADHVIVTAPLPQTFGLLADTAIELDRQLFRTDYDRTICLLAVLDRAPGTLPSGGAQPDGGIFGFVGDNESKGISAAPAITLHARPDWSEEHWDDDVESLGSLLVDAATAWLGGAEVVERQVKKWRFATPRSVWPDPCWVSPDGSIVLAGDAFAGPRVEGAHNSGLAAAHAIIG